MLLYKDQVKLNLVAGAGGKGSLAFYRSRSLPRGGPDGGDGGNGGNIGFFSDARYKDFAHLKKQSLFKAKRGGNGNSRLQSGRKGKDLLIPVPPGTLLRDAKGRLLKDLNQAENPFFFLKGGLGGKGNAFYKSSVNQAPVQFQKGLSGEQKQIILELKPLVDIALVGRVNSGKSTFFNKMTGGKSPVGDYACTTLCPYYGQMKAFSSPCFLMDIPGIPEGRGERAKQAEIFLRLMGRAKLLLIFVSAGEQPLEHLRQIKKDLTHFDKNCSEREFALKNKKRIIVLSKSDQLQKRDSKKELEVLLSETISGDTKGNERIQLLANRDTEISNTRRAMAFSSKTEMGIKELLLAIQENL